MCTWRDTFIMALKDKRKIFFFVNVCFFTTTVCLILCNTPTEKIDITKMSTNALLLRRLKTFNAEIERIRNEFLRETSSPQRHLNACHSSNVVVADASSSIYFKMFEQFPDIRTVLYEDSLENISGYLRPKYYHYMSNDCKLLENKSKGGQNLARTRYDAECRESFSDTWQSYGLREVALGVGLPRNARAKGNDSRLLTFIHVIPDAVSFSNGDVLHGNLKIVPEKCHRSIKRSCPSISNSAPKYKEVFTITQYWGSGFYHAMLENLPRMAPYLSFLERNPQIRIHVASRFEYFSLLGIKKSRLITASAVHADVLYMPAGGPCGNSPLFTTQLLASAISNSSKKQVPLKKRDVIVLIKRRHKRWFANHEAILRMLERYASHLDLTVEVFGDNPLPNIRRTIDMFSRALVVIAPHGAGEANLILSQPGTLLIEGLCYDGDNMTNLCYRNMAQALGLRYYGLIYRHQCMKITPKQIERPLMKFLSRMCGYDVTTLQASTEE